MLRFLPILALAALGGCGATSDGNAAFRATGEIIAFGGGNGGAASACVTCHGLKGEGDGRLTPRLAGLEAGYLHRQLDDYVNGRREHGVMRAVARRLSGEDRAKLAAYYAALPGPAATQADRSSLYRRKCAQCHGPAGEGKGPANPPLAGQPPAYIAAQLKAWRSGRRRDPMDVMLAVSRALTASELQALAGRGEAPPLPARPP